MVINIEVHMNKEQEYQAKYMVLVAWISEKTGLSEDSIEEVVNQAYDKNLRQDLEDYCNKLFDGEEVDEQ